MDGDGGGWLCMVEILGMYPRHYMGYLGNVGYGDSGHYMPCWDNPRGININGPI